MGSGKLLKAEQNNINTDFDTFLSGAVGKKRTTHLHDNIILVSVRIRRKRISMKQHATILFWNKPNQKKKKVATGRLNSALKF